MLRTAKVKKEKFMLLQKAIKIWNVSVDNIVISKSVKTKANSRYLIEYPDKARRPLILIMSKMIC